MLRNHLQSFSRHFQKSRGFALINLAGLGIGLAVSLLMLIYIRYELSYDRFYPEAENLYRIVMDQPTSNFQGNTMFAVTPATLKPELENNFPEVLSATRIDGMVGGLLSIDDRQFIERGVMGVDPEFLGLFDVEMVVGDRATALAAPFTMVISQSMAKKYFGTEDAVGKVIKKDQSQDYAVTGVFKDFQKNSHLSFDALYAFSSLYSLRGGQGQVEIWNNNSYWTYVQLRPGTDPEQVAQSLTQFSQDFIGEDRKDSFIFQPVTGIHLGGNINLELASNSDARLLTIFGAVAVLILAIASLNYMNLSTARSLERSREVGMRKVLGAGRRQIMVQFMGESLLYALLSLGLAMLIVQLLLPFFSGLVQRELPLNLPFKPANLGLMVALTLLAGVVSGLYPALYLSRFNPMSIFRSADAQGRDHSQRLRNALVLFQFFISAGLIGTTLIMQKQLYYIHHKNLGFETQQIVTIRLRDPELRRQYQPLQQALAALPGVQDITASGQIPITIRSNSSARWEGKQSGQRLQVYKLAVDAHTLDFYGIECVAGRLFQEGMTTDQNGAYLLNETAVRALGWDEALGKTFGFRSASVENSRVIGVVKDFHFYPLSHPIEPLAIMLIDESFDKRMMYLSLKIDGQNIRNIMPRVKETVDRFSPRFPAQIDFFDQRLQALYANEQRLISAFNACSTLAIFIACLGLVGLAAYAADRRAREISIRKVLGASGFSILSLLSRSFLRWVLLANALAIPLVWWFMKGWLEHFAYRTHLGAGIFLAAAGISLIIALLAMGSQTVKAANSRPAEVLRRSN